MEDNGTFGSRLAARRRLLNKRQEAVAREAGVSQRFLSKLEHDGCFPSWDVAVKLARALDTHLNYLSGFGPS